MIDGLSICPYRAIQRYMATSDMILSCLSAYRQSMPLVIGSKCIGVSRLRFSPRAWAIGGICSMRSVQSATWAKLPTWVWEYSSWTPIKKCRAAHTASICASVSDCKHVFVGKFEQSDKAVQDGYALTLDQYRAIWSKYCEENCIENDGYYNVNWPLSH